jgi:hypothetical protein
VTTPAQDRQKYLRAALVNQYNVILFGGSLSFSAALGSWLPLVSGLVGEAVWLLSGPRLSAFRRSADAREGRALSLRAIEALAPEYAASFAVVEREVGEIEELCAARYDLSEEQRQEVSSRLRPLLQCFVAVCGMHQRVRRAAAQTRLDELRAELSTLHQSLASETDLGVRASLRRALSVAERRIRQREINEATCRSLELALQTLQKSLALLKEGAAGLGNAVELCAEVDAVTAQLSRASALDAEHESELGPARLSVLPPPLN